MSGWPWTTQTSAVSSRRRRAEGRRVDPAVAVDPHQVERGARRAPRVRQAASVAGCSTALATTWRPRARGSPRSRPLHGQVARLGGAGGEDHPLRVGAHQRGDLRAGRARAPRPARRPHSWRLDGLPNASPSEGQHRLAHARVERGGGRVVEVGRRRVTGPRRAGCASSDGRPASQDRVLRARRRRRACGGTRSVVRLGVVERPRGARVVVARLAHRARGSPASAPRSSVQPPAGRDADGLHRARRVVSRQAKGMWVWPISVSGHAPVLQRRPAPARPRGRTPRPGRAGWRGTAAPSPSGSSGAQPLAAWPRPTAPERLARPARSPRAPGRRTRPARPRR